MNFNEFFTISGIIGMIIGGLSFLILLDLKLQYGIVGNPIDLPTFLSAFIFVIGLIIITLSIEEKTNE